MQRRSGIFIKGFVNWDERSLNFCSRRDSVNCRIWIPAFAGMTGGGN